MLDARPSIPDKTTPPHRDILVIGSLNADLVVRVPRFAVPGETVIGRDFRTFWGGKGANQAYAAAKLGGRVRMVGQVGSDSQGQGLRDNLAAVNVDVTGLAVDPDVSTGIATITIDEHGQNQIIIIPGANGTFAPHLLSGAEAALSQASLVLLQLEIPLPTVERAAALAKRAGALVILDPAPAQPLPDPLLGSLDYLTPNESELAILSGQAPTTLSRDQASVLARRLLARGPRAVLVKMGSQGALLVAAGREHFWPALPVQAVDTTAAGDAFNAAFAVALARGATELEAGDFATAAAACSVTRPGAQLSMPTVGEIAALLRSTGRVLRNEALMSEELPGDNGQEIDVNRG